MTASALQLLTNGRANSVLLGQISETVAAVEAVLDAQMHSSVSIVQGVGYNTLKAGGKRLRPAFVTLAAKATNLPFEVERAHRLGACMEMIHMATLVHDDVIDNSPTRRGFPTAASEFGNTAAILSGDVLLAKAMVLLAKDNDVDLILTVSEAVVDMAEGEVRELEVRGDFDLEEAAHLEVLRRKTASFIEACCEVGAQICDAPQSFRQALRNYGFHIGLAFQIVDDLLDYRGDQSKTGKQIATDFREGQATLPLLYLRETMSDAEAKVVRRKFGSTTSDDEIRLVVDWMGKRGAFQRAQRLAEQHVHSALDALDVLPETNAKELLKTVGQYVLDRQQ